MRSRLAVLAFLALAIPALAQDSPSSRDATREKLRKLLDVAGKRPDVNVIFRQSTKEPYNFVGSMTDRMGDVGSLEIVLRVTPSDTIGIRVYPHYKDDYINLEKVKDPAGLMKKMLRFSDTNFLYWGADSTNDVFCGYTFTLESGFPEEAMTIVLRSIRSTDGFVGDLRPFIDGSSPAPKKQ
jgi:hypothetical protein